MFGYSCSTKFSFIFDVASWLKIRPKSGKP